MKIEHVYYSEPDGNNPSVYDGFCHHCNKWQYDYEAHLPECIKKERSSESELNKLFSFFIAIFLTVKDKVLGSPKREFHMWRRK